MTKLYKECWNLMSKCVRLQDADWKGYVSCYTCGVTQDYKEMDAGHLFHNRLDFDFRNIKPQCKICNQYKDGNHKVFRKKAEKEYGKEVVDKMYKSGYVVYNDSELKNIKEVLKLLLKLIKQYD